MTSANAALAAKPAAQPAWKRLLLSEYLVLVLTVLYFLGMWTVVPEIATSDTLLDILSAMMPLLVVAIGQTFVLIVAGIDLSAPSIIAMASVVGASVMTGDAGYANGTGLEIPAGILAFIAYDEFAFSGPEIRQRTRSASSRSTAPVRQWRHPSS